MELTMASSPPPPAPVDPPLAMTETLTLSVVDQTMCRHYIRNVLCFPFPDMALAEQAVSQLRRALRLTLQKWPFLAGRIRLVPGEGPHGNLQLRYSPSVPALDDSLPIGGDDFEHFEVRWHRNDSPAQSITFDHMTTAGMPSSLLPTHLVCSLPDSPDLSLDASSWPPVLHLAANFIPGGLLLAVYASHSIIDGVGLGHLIDVFAENVRSCTSDHVEPVRSTIYDRSLITEAAHKAFLAGRAFQCPEFKYRTSSTVPITPSRPISPPKIIGRIFSFSASSLSQLRQAICGYLANDSTLNVALRQQRISTWDTLAALLWVYQIRARFGGGGDDANADGSTRTEYDSNGSNAPSNGSSPPASFTLHEERQSPPPTSRFGYTINVRRRLDPPLPDSYIGNAVLYTYTEVDRAVLLSPITTAVHLHGSSRPPSDVPLQALAVAALHIRSANTDFDTDAIYGRLAYLTQVPRLQTGSLVPNMVIAQDDPDFAPPSAASSVTSSPAPGMLELKPRDSFNLTMPQVDLVNHQSFSIVMPQDQQRLHHHHHPSQEHPPPDVFATSWQDIGANSNFSIIGTDPNEGRPTYVRKPKSTFAEGGTIVLPRRRRHGRSLPASTRHSATNLVFDSADTSSLPIAPAHHELCESADEAMSPPLVIDVMSGDDVEDVEVVDTEALSRAIEEEAPPYDVLLQLPEEHMEILCRDSELGGWVTKIVE